jgi:hypothetical protein
VLEMWSAQRPPAPAVLPRVPCCIRQGHSPTARGPAAGSAPARQCPCLCQRVPATGQDRARALFHVP